MKVSVMVLTKNRPEFLTRALYSIQAQSFKDLEIVLISDGSMNLSQEQQIASQLQAAGLNIHFIYHKESFGITESRQEALDKASGEFVAILDDDDEWVDRDKLKKQVEYLNSHLEGVLVGGGIRVELGMKNYEFRMRPETDEQIRNQMLLKNPFFTSTVMLRREAAVKVGGFKKDDIDLVEDYNLWLRMGKLGQLYNFPEVFTAYRLPEYNKAKLQLFLSKQLRLIKQHQNDYPHYWLAQLILRSRLILTS